MPLDEQSLRLVQFVIANQQYKINKLIWNIHQTSIFSELLSKQFWPLVLRKRVVTYLDDDSDKLQTKTEMFTSSWKTHQTFKTKKLKAAPKKSHFFLKMSKFLGHIIKWKTMKTWKFRKIANLKLQSTSNKTAI